MDMIERLSLSLLIYTKLINYISKGERACQAWRQSLQGTCCGEQHKLIRTQVLLWKVLSHGIERYGVETQRCTLPHHFFLNFMKTTIRLHVIIKCIFGGFPGGLVLENLPANAGDMGSTLGPGRSHVPRNSCGGTGRSGEGRDPALPPEPQGPRNRTKGPPGLSGTSEERVNPNANAAP